MNRSKPFFKILTLIVLSNLLLAGCSSAAQPAEPQLAADPVQAFFTDLSVLQTVYDFSAIEEVYLSAGADTIVSEDGVQWQAQDGEVQPVDGVTLNNGEGIFLTFSFSQSLDETDDALYFELEPLTGDETAQQAFISSDGLMLLKEGLPAGNVAFQDGLDWQTGSSYAMFIMVTQAGGLEVRLWDEGQPEKLALLTSDQTFFAGDAAQFGLKVSGAQTLTIHSMWRLLYDGDAGTSVKTAQTDKGQDQVAEAKPAELNGYPVISMASLDTMMCEDEPVGENGVFSWGANYNGHCDQRLKMGEALAFDFALANPAESWPKVAFIMLDANMEGTDMPLKGLGIPLANDKVVAKLDGKEIATIEYSDGFELEAGMTYSMLIIMTDDNYFKIEIWPKDNPEMRMNAFLTDDQINPDWLPVEEEQWAFGLWIAEQQQVTITNLVHYTLGDAALDTAAREEASSEASAANSQGDQPEPLDPDWVAEGVIPNLNDFFIPEITPYSDIECGDELVYQNRILNLPIENETNTYQCQTEVPERTGLIFEFDYSGENANQIDTHLWDIAFALGEGEQQKIIRYMPGDSKLTLKMGPDYAEDVPMQGAINWEPGKRYTVVFIPTDDKYIFIWPSDDPQQVLSAVVSGLDWKNSFGVDDPNQNWQLRLWVGSGIDMKIVNIFSFMPQ